MKRLTIRLRQKADGTVERMSASNVWAPTGIGPNMSLGGEMFQTLSQLLFFQLHDMRQLSDADWALRISQQQKIGSALRKALLGDQPIGALGPWLHLKPEKCEPDVSVVPSEFMDLFCRVPWSLMTSSDASNATFVALNPVEPQIISLDAAPDLEHPEWYRLIRFPSTPRVLLVMPNVKDESYDDTTANAHAASLRDQLQPYYDAMGAANCLRVVETYKDFISAVGDDTFDPHIIYFYGHALTDGAGTDFVFQHSDGGPDERSVDEIQQWLSELVVRTKFPPVVWFNACFGASAKQESALRVLGPWTCCMITTRTLAAVDVSRSLAEFALPEIIIRGLCPTVAIRNAILAKKPTVRGARWANLVIAVHFDQWSALGAPERQADDRESVGDFPMRCDRAIPLERIEARIRDSFARTSVDARTRVCSTIAVWCGDFEQGLTIFEERVADLLLDRFPNWRVTHRQVDLKPDYAPAAPRDRKRYLLSSLWGGLIGSPSTGETEVDYATIIRTTQAIVSNRRAVLALTHGPQKEADVGLVQDYIQLIKNVFADVKRVQEQDLQIVLAFGFEIPQKSSSLEISGIRVEKLGPIPPRELAQHLTAYGRFYSLSTFEAEETASRLIDDFEGRFIVTYEELKRLAGLK